MFGRGMVELRIGKRAGVPRGTGTHVEALGPKLRKKRLRLGLTLDELAGRTGISKPYLSLIETGRVPNPPSDEKLRRLEQTLGFTAGELVSQAHLQRTPRDVRAVLQSLIKQRNANGDAGTKAGDEARLGPESKTGAGAATSSSVLSPQSSVLKDTSLNLDDAYLSGVLREMVDRSRPNVEHVRTNAIP